MSSTGRVVDLRSDTVTRPTAAMRAAIAAAEVGDDQLGDDPTVRRLEERVARLLGKERALFFPTGIMANQTAVMLHASPGTEAVLEASAHIVDWEEAAAAAWGGVQLRAVATDDGILTADRVKPAIRPAANPYQPRTALICVENTHNAAGGRVMPPETLNGIRRLADEHGLPIHLDGARLWNASAATRLPPAELAAPADTVMVTLSKGLGCPAGSILAGEAAAIREAWRTRRRMGGAMRQSGILAAAGLHALDHHLDRLADDHARAARLARGLDPLDGLRVRPPETNIVMIDLLRDDLDAPTVVSGLAEEGVLLSMFSTRRLRAVTHLDVDDQAIDRAIEAVSRFARRRG